MVVWLVGLSGAGKTTIARHLLDLRRRLSPQVVLLDGEALRRAVDDAETSPAFDRASRARREERVAVLCALLEKQGLDVICALNSVDQGVRDRNRSRFTDYFEVYVATPLDVCLQRDDEGLYDRALRGETENVVGLDLALDPPRCPDMVVDNGHPSSDPARIAEHVHGAALRKQRRRPISPPARRSANGAAP